MDIRELQSVLAVYQFKSFSEAAYRTDFSLSAISKHVSRVEKEFGLKLFERKTKSSQMQLTENGEIILPAIDKVVTEYGNLEWLVESLSVTGRNLLSIGYDLLLGQIGEEEILTDFMIKHSDVEIRQVLLYRKDLIRLLLSGQLDGIFIMMIGRHEGNMQFWDSITSDEMQIIPTMKSNKLYIGMSDKKELADKGSVRLEEIVDETFIFSSFQNPKYYSSLIYEVEKKCKEIDKTLKVKYMDFIQKNIVFNLVAEGEAVLPMLCIPPRHISGVKFVPLDQWDIETTGMFVCRKRTMCKSLKELCRCVREHSPQ